MYIQGYSRKNWAQKLVTNTFFAEIVYFEYQGCKNFGT